MADVESRVSSLEKNFEVFMQEMRDFKDEMKDFRREMRDRDNQRAAEIARTDAKIEKLREQREKDMKAIEKRRENDNAKYDDAIRDLNKKIDDKFDKLSSQIQNMAIAAVVGVGAIVWAVVSAVK